MRDTKERIQSEALRLFAGNGYHAVTVEQIAAAVGIKAPSLYKHYSGKRAIFYGIVHQMEERDLQQARVHRMPEENGTAENPAGEPATMEKLSAFSRAQFRYWTEETFPSRFRRMLTLEQYRDPEMARLYRQYLSAGPVDYLTDIFRPGAASREEARLLALEFYGPMFLLYSIYDSGEKNAAALLEAHLARFSKKYPAAQGEKEGSSKNDE